MVAAVELHEQAGSGHALPAPTVSGRAASAGTAEPCRAEDTMDGGLGQHEPFTVGQELAEVRVVDPGVGSLGEMDEPRPGGGRDALGEGRPRFPWTSALGPCRRYARRRRRIWRVERPRRAAAPAINSSPRSRVWRTIRCCSARCVKVIMP